MASRFPLHMISNQPTARLHSQMDQGRTSRDSKINGHEPITMHPADAAARGLTDGDIARVFNERGEFLAGATTSDDILSGVVALATGAWYDPSEPGKAGTLDKGTSKRAQGPSAQSALVEIERYDGVAPEITVFSQPTIIREP